MSTAIPTGLILGEPNATYHGNDAVSSSKLSDMRVAGKLCPQNYYQRHVAKTAPREKGAHFDIGIAAHLLILEGTIALSAAVAVTPETYTNEKGEKKKWSGNAKVCQAWEEENKKDKTVLTQKEAALVGRLALAIDGHPAAKELTSKGTAEVTFRKEIGGLVNQCRVDKWHPNGVLGSTTPTIVDLKTCNTLEQFEREFYYLRYNFRAEYYRLVVSEVLADIAGTKASEIEAPDYLFVVVEKSVPHRVKVYRPDEDSLLAGRKEVHADLITLRNCHATGIWPTGTEDGIASIGLQTWQLAKSNDTSDSALNII